LSAQKEPAKTKKKEELAPASKGELSSKRAPKKATKRKAVEVEG
jgi:hypothetical protein